MKDHSELNVMVLDLETSISNSGEDAVGSFKASPYHPSNRIVYYGFGNDLSDKVHVCGLSGEIRVCADLSHKIPKASLHFGNERFWLSIRYADVLVGHNIKFDLLHLLMEDKRAILDFIKKGGQIWDTMHAEYLLSGQSEIMPSLDKLAPEYGGTLKDSRVKDYWKNGIETDKIPPNEIIPYLIGDVENTTIIFRQQVERCIAADCAFQNLIETQMSAIVATTIMEFNGMHFSIAAAEPIVEDLLKEHDRLGARIAQWMVDELELHSSNAIPYHVVIEDVNPNSNAQLATVLFGGTFSYTRSMPVHELDGSKVLIKSGVNKGKPKMKNTQLDIEIPVDLALCWSDTIKPEMTPKGNVKLDDAAISGMLGNYPQVSRDLKNIIKYRSLSKELNTYYLKLMELVWPTDSCIHGNLNHSITATGRLSSSTPNMQNIHG